MTPTTSKSKFDSDEGASPGSGKIFIGGLAKDTTSPVFIKHFGKYGEIVDSVIIKDRHTGLPRGFGFITFADPSVVDKVMEDTHIINGKQVEIKRTVPKGSSQQKEFRTKKIFVGGIPPSLTEDEFRNFFSNYGDVVEHQIIYDHQTNRSRGFGFIIFDSEDIVDDMLSKGNMIEMAGTQVEIKKAEPKKSSNPPFASGYANYSRPHSFDDGLGVYNASYNYNGGFVTGPYRTTGNVGVRTAGGLEYVSGSEDFSSGYHEMGFGSLGSYRDESFLGYYGRFGPYSGGYSGTYDSALGGHSRGGEGYNVFGGGFYASHPGNSHGGSGPYGRGGYSNSRYHPYAR